MIIEIIVITIIISIIIPVFLVLNDIYRPRCKNNQKLKRKRKINGGNMVTIDVCPKCKDDGKIVELETVNSIDISYHVIKLKQCPNCKYCNLSHKIDEDKYDYEERYRKIIDHHDSDCGMLF